MSIWTSRIRTFAVILVGSLMLAANAVAVTFTVDSILDQIDDDTSDGICHTAAGTCTLRAAVMSANKASGSDVTIMLPAGTYTLIRPAAGADGDDSGDLNLTAPESGYPVINIIGAGASVTIIDANQIDRVLSVESSRSALLSGITLRNGFVSGDGAGIHNENAIELDDCVVSGNTGATRGGGIYNNGVVILNRSTLTGNTAASGGGIFDDLVSAVYATDSTFSGNHALGGSGGGIAAPSGTVLEFTHCTFTGNTATGPGGAIGSAGMLSLDLSTVQGNTANDSGGGVDIELSGAASVSRSTISGNVSHFVGGGICFFATTLTMINSTIALNEADADGGGIYSDPLPSADVNINIYSSTIVFNDADHDRDGGAGGGIFHFGSSGNGFNLYNTVVAGNTMGNQPLYDDCDTAGDPVNNPGFVKTHARNLFGTTDGCTILPISGSYALLNSLALLGPLQHNGGPTETVALLAGSNAIDGTILGVGCRDSQSQPIAVDQRGFVRGADSACDVGAYEYNDIFANGFEVIQ